jgi:hypothetical protein
VTEIENLRQRRELVMLAADLQRATITRRLERIEANPARRVFGFAAQAASRPVMLRLGSALVAYAYRTYRKKQAMRAIQRSGH